MMVIKAKLLLHSTLFRSHHHGILFLNVEWVNETCYLLYLYYDDHRWSKLVHEEILITDFDQIYSSWQLVVLIK